MNTMLIVLRVVHVMGGVFWAGAVLFVAHFLEPAVRATGPDGGRVMQALQKKNFHNVIPIVAAFTLVSGFWLYWRDFGRFHPGAGASGVELTYAIGGLAALVAFVIGATMLRPTIVRLGALGAQLAQAEPARREALGGEMASLQARARLAGRLVAGLLGITIIAMAIGRYV
jgi:uncharacterized membrane protein